MIKADAKDYTIAHLTSFYLNTHAMRNSQIRSLNAQEFETLQRQIIVGEEKIGGKNQDESLELIEHSMPDGYIKPAKK